MKKDDKNKNLVVTQSNEVTEAAYYMPLHSKRIIWLCLASIRPKTVNHSGIFKISVNEYAKTFNLTTSNASRNVKDGALSLLNQSVIFYENAGEENEILGVPWLYEMAKKRGRGEWIIHIHPKIMPYLLGLKKQYTTFDIVNCEELKNTRQIRLYECLSQFKNSGVWLTSPEWICDRFVLPEMYKSNFAEFKRRFLDPTLRKINSKTKLTVSYKTKKDKSKITGLIFEISKKND